MLNKDADSHNGSGGEQLKTEIAELQKQVALLNERQAQLDKGEK